MFVEVCKFGVNVIVVMCYDLIEIGLGVIEVICYGMVV